MGLVVHNIFKVKKPEFVEACITGSIRGLTIVEMIIALSLMTIVFASIVPIFSQINQSWDSKQAAAETLQNGRVLMDHIQRNLSRAVKITSVSNSSETDGYIEFENRNSEIQRYDTNSSSSYVEFGQAGNLSDLAGPVSSLKFTCYDAFDLDTSLVPVIDTNSIRVVKVEATFTNTQSSQQDKTLSVLVYLRTNSQGSSGDWQNQDIGNVQTAGSANVSGSTWTISASGNDIWNSSDEFHFVYQSLSGDGQIIARVVSVEDTDRWAKAGVMIRETLDDSSKHAMMVITPGNGSAFQRRTRTGNGSSHTAGSDITAPYWVKLIRNGDTFTGYESADGSIWNEVGSDYISMATDIYIGLAVTSHNDGTLCTALIDNVSFNTVTYETFTEEKLNTSGASITIQTPVTNTGDLLVTAIATDGDTSSSLSPPFGENWTEIIKDDYSNDITLGVWYKLAEELESSSHQFSWSNTKQAYGWMMRFTGHDSTNPIAIWSDYGQISSTPISSAITTTQSNSLILRVGAFNSSDITIDDPGLNNHTAITMENCYGVLFQDDFESGYAKWTDGGNTDWEVSYSIVYSGNYSAWCDRWDNDLISDNIDTSSYDSFSIEFWYRVDGIDNNDNVYLQLYNGSSYINYYEIGNASEDIWILFQATINDSQFCRSNFRIKFEGSSIDNKENLWIDDVIVSAGGISGGAGYMLQSAIGDSGTSNFSLGSATEYKTLTLAINSQSDNIDGLGEIRP